MRIALSAICVLGLYIPGALAGGGTVTSTEAGPQTLTLETTDQILDAMSVEVPTTQAPVIQFAPPPPPPVAPIITHAAPPPAPPLSDAEKAEAEKPTKVEVAAASGPLDPRETVQQCATCHGYDGLAKIPTAPNIAGSSRQYLETQLKAFRSGKRENEVMAVIAEDLSNAEIKVVAKWYAGLKVTVEGNE